MARKAEGGRGRISINRVMESWVTRERDSSVGVAGKQGTGVKGLRRQSKARKTRVLAGYGKLGGTGGAWLQSRAG